MADRDSKKYYWLKLDKDFFKRDDINLIESMENGEKYIIFYLKLLCVSINQEGKLMVSDHVPYNPKTLSVVTRTDIDIVRSAINVFSEFDMITVLDGGEIYMNEVKKMIGCETGGARRKREYRERIGTNVGQCPAIEEKSPKKISTKKFTKPTIEDISAYCIERNNGIDPQEFYDYYESVGWKVGNKPMKDWKACVRTWEQRRKASTSTQTFKYDLPNQNYVTDEQLYDSLGNLDE